MSNELKIPQKLLTDNFKLKDYQDDFNFINNLIVSNLLKPTRIEFRNNTFSIYYGINKVEYIYGKDTATNRINKITNVTENRVIDIVWNT